MSPGKKTYLQYRENNLIPRSAHLFLACLPSRTDQVGSQLLRLQVVLLRLVSPAQAGAESREKQQRAVPRDSDDSATEKQGRWLRPR